MIFLKLKKSTQIGNFVIPVFLLLPFAQYRMIHKFVFSFKYLLMKEYMYI